MKRTLRYLLGPLFLISLFFIVGASTYFSQKKGISETITSQSGDQGQKMLHDEQDATNTTTKEWNAFGEIGSRTTPKAHFPSIRDEIESNAQVAAIADSITALKEKVGIGATPKNQGPQTHIPDVNVEAVLATISDTENYFPTYVLDGLDRMQDGFIKAKVWKPEEKIVFKSERDVFRMMDKSLDTLFKLGAFKTDYEKKLMKYALFVNYKKVWDSERSPALKGTTSFVPDGKAPVVKIAKDTKDNRPVVQKIAGIFMPQEVLAQASEFNDFVTIPDCWKAKDKTGTYKGGSNLQGTFCCNCGLLYLYYTVEFKWDCGTEDSGDCNIPLGCLNALCAGQHNAIFDGPPGYKEPAYAGWGGGFSTDWSLTCGCDAF